jgi:hypothetical protein
MKRFPKILAAGLNKVLKHPLALLVGVALLVAAADVALVSAYQIRQEVNGGPRADALRPLHLDAASASAADHPITAEATSSLPPGMDWKDCCWRPGGSWTPFWLRWSSLTLPYGAEEGSPTDVRQYLAELPGR